MDSKDISKISSDWINVLKKIFPLAVINYEDFLILKDFKQKINDTFSSESSHRFADIVMSPVYSWFNNDIQKYVAVKLFEELSDVIEYLEREYNTFGVFNNSTHSLEKRLISKVIISYKYWLEVYYSPDKLIEYLNSKRKYNQKDYKLISELKLTNYNDSLIENLYSDKLSLSDKFGSLEALFNQNDDANINVFKNLSNDVNVNSIIREKIIENLLGKNIADKEFWTGLKLYLKNEKLISLIDLKINLANKDFDGLLDFMSKADITVLSIVFEMLAFVKLPLKITKKIIEYIFDIRQQKIGRKFRYPVSETSIKYFTGYLSSDKIKRISFCQIFSKKLAMVGKINKSIFINYINLLSTIFEKIELEYLFGLTYTNIKVKEKKIFVNSLKKYIKDSTFLNNINSENRELINSTTKGSL